VLPKEKRKRKLGFPEQATWLVYGPPKVGKTTSAATWPEPLIIECEPGVRARRTASQAGPGP